MPQSPLNIAYMRAAGVSLAIDLASQVPRILHWGADLGEMDGPALQSLRLTAGTSVLNNAPDTPRVLSLWPTEHEGWSGTPSIAGHRGGTQTTPRLQLNHVHTEGGDAGGRLELGLTDLVSGVDIEATYTLTAEGLLEVESSSTSHLTDGPAFELNSIRTMLPLPARATEILDLTGKWSRERSPQRQPVRDGSHSRTVRRGKPGADSPYLMLVGTPGFGFRHGEVWGMHVAWSGNQQWFVERLPEGAGSYSAVLGGGELLQPGEIRLEHGGTYRAPKLVFAWSGQGTDGIADRFHENLRHRLLHPSSARPLVLNTWEAVYFDHDLDRLIELTDRAAELGIERLVLDDGWFHGRRDDSAGLGDWTVDAGIWPKGLHPLVDRIRSHGMQFGLWVEPEMVNLDSDIAREHPEWLLAPSEGVGLPSRRQFVLNIAREDSWQYLLKHLDQLVNEYSIDYLKWDHNRDLLEAVARGAGGDRPGVHAQTTALYALIDELKRRHPALEIESCSAGGARVDLGILDRTDRVWASDCNDPLERQSIQQWTSLLLPPELVGSHVGAPRSHTTGRVADLPIRLATSLFAHAGVEWDITRCGPEEMTALKAWGKLYREFRELIHTGRTVHADLSDPNTLLHGSVAADGKRALFSWVRLATSGFGQSGRVTFPGLEPDKRYRVRVRDELGPASLHQGAGPAWVEQALEGWVDIPGTVLANVGVPLPTLNPGHVMLFEVRSAE
ncbi:alpha-galactosidase [Arthrobacter sp. 24S4-2]|uniref:alpha-galactosidase n=1 Tax=Arthrobacter sp. 24S4-2 TaxID=2575374 RepID=UPI0010C7B135|nr:alpha-galactosidase [Arthrobacter sp. 24S4-2]QCO98102.1 alpha-galactosidase [Arthrobacter sp. 24S4-2]